MNEKELLAILKSDADTYAKAMACDNLGRVGGATAVPTLAALLADEKLNDYARDALERIADPAAGKALRDALGKLKGDLRVGVIITLGDRRDMEAVPALAKAAKAGETTAAGAALASLGQIANDDAAAAILEILSIADAAAETRTAAAHAAVAAAEVATKDGRAALAKKLRTAVTSAADAPAHLKKSAAK